MSFIFYEILKYFKKNCIKNCIILIRTDYIKDDEIKATFDA